MKLFCYLMTLSLLVTEAHAGLILPNLSRSKSVPNSSPIAVGFSNRNSATLSFAHESEEGDVAGVKSYEQTSKEGSLAIFTSASKVHMELSTSFANQEKDFTSTVTSDDSTNLYDFNASVAAPLAENFSAGVSVRAARLSVLTGNTKSINNSILITPGVGMKIQPNLAVGAGVNYKINKFKSVVVNTSTTELPTLSTAEIFAGAAYGVDQKIGENGFGVEGIIAHQFKKQAQKNGIALSSGATTTLLANGHYIQDALDMTISAFFSKGKDYYDNNTLSNIALAIQPEYMISNPFYVAPLAGYLHSKNSSSTGLDDNSTDKGWLYGLGLGMRTAQYDLNVTYTHGAMDSDPGKFEVDSNIIAGRVSLYF